MRKGRATPARSKLPLGAKVRVTAGDGMVQYNQATTAVGFASSSDSRVHFGLGESKLVREIEITWPSRIRQTLRNVAADRVLTIEERPDTPSSHLVPSRK